MQYTKHFNVTKTPPTQPIPGTNMVPNSGGGFSFQIDEWEHLDRFCIMGAEGGSFYASEKKLTVENAENVIKLLKEDGPKVIETITEISWNGRAPKEDPVLFVLAMAFKFGDAVTKKLASAAVPKIARYGTTFFKFLSALRGFGLNLSASSVRRAVASYYNGKTPDALALDLIKFGNREGFTHVDVCRMSHFKPADAAHDNLVHWALKGEFKDAELAPKILEGYAKIRESGLTAKKAAKLIQEYGLPREVVPTEFLKDAAIWEALLEKMPPGALIRNLGNMSKAEILKPLSQAERLVTERLTNMAALKKARIHPIKVLLALNTYGSGHSAKGDGPWSVNQKVVNALDAAFYLSFETVEPTGKNHLLALDVSDSMTWNEIAKMPGITPRVASAAMAMATDRAESNTHVMGFSDGMREINITSRQRLDEVVSAIRRVPAGATDCSLPMVYATKNKLEVDAFVVYTDSVANTGQQHAAQALREYRQKMGRPAKLIVVAMEATNLSIGDPNDAGTLNVCGFSPAVPAVLASFVRDKNQKNKSVSEDETDD